MRALPAPSRRRRNLSGAVLAGLLLSLAVPAAASADPPPAAPLEDLADAGPEQGVGVDEQLGAFLPLDTVFRDETGREVALGELVDRPTLIAPVYYECPNVCSYLQGALARALPQVRRQPGADYRVLSLSFDVTETPADARRSKAIYYQAMGGDFPADAWHFLTGDREAIRAVTAAAGYNFRREGEDFLHPVAVFVVSSEGKITRYLYGTSILPMDLTLALVEAAEGRVNPAVRKVAQFCFSYDPQSGQYVFNIFRVSATVILLTAGAFLAFLLWTGRKRQESEHPS